jgi:hypothetical protein
MANYPLNRTIFNKDAYQNTIDTSFNQSSTPSPPLKDTISVPQFFEIYNNIFYDIPTTGTVNSHEYLIKRSSEYANLSTQNEDIQMLLDEITSLQSQLLTANQQILNLQTSSLQTSSLM